MAKKQNEHIKLDEIINDFIENNNLQIGLDKVNVEEAWRRLMGNGVNNYTTQVSLKKQTLYVALSSSVLREELSYGNQKIINLLNEALGKELIKKLVLR